MSIFSKIFGKKQTSETDEIVRVGGMEDFMTLIRVYYQSVMAAQLGISNINFLPDMAVFKRTLKIQMISRITSSCSKVSARI